MLFNRKMEGTTGEVTSETNPPTNPRDADSYENYILIDRNTSTSGDGKIMVISAFMEDGAKSVILNLTSNISSGHTYDLYANASKVINSTNSTLVDDPHTDLAVEDKCGTVGLRSYNNLPLDVSNATVEVDVDEPSVLEVRIDAVQSIIDPALAALNGGTEVFADFITAGVTGAVEANKAANVLGSFVRLKY